MFFSVAASSPSLLKISLSPLLTFQDDCLGGLVLHEVGFSLSIYQSLILHSQGYEYYRHPEDSQVYIFFFLSLSLRLMSIALVMTHQIVHWHPKLSIY